MPSRGSARKLALERPGRPRRGPPPTRPMVERALHGRPCGGRHSIAFCSAQLDVAIGDRSRQIDKSALRGTPRGGTDLNDRCACRRFEGADRSPPSATPCASKRGCPLRSVDVIAPVVARRPSEQVRPTGRQPQRESARRPVGTIPVASDITDSPNRNSKPQGGSGGQLRRAGFVALPVFVQGAEPAPRRPGGSS
jgi:hypothetical protein